MSNINDVKNIMELDRWFPMCDVGEIGEDYIHLISWNEDIPKTDFDTIAELIANDGYDVSAFELLEIPHPKVCGCSTVQKEKNTYELALVGVRFCAYALISFLSCRYYNIVNLT